MSKPKNEENAEPPSVHVISDSEDETVFGNGFAGFSSAQKRVSLQLDDEHRREPRSARKKLKIDVDKPVEPAEEPQIDIDSISTNPRRTRTKVSSDTSSKFPVSSPSDTMPLAGHRKKYVKNTLPAGAFERKLNEVAQSHPLMTFTEKLDKWTCSNDLSDVEDVNNFDDQFHKREQQYKKTSLGRRSAEKDTTHPHYNYQHFRTVILENLKSSPISITPSPEAPPRKINNGADLPSCSKESSGAANTSNAASAKPEAIAVYEKILCPSSESSVTKASPSSIRLHWTDEESVFRIKSLNPEIDKFSRLIKMRIDYNKQINLKAKINEIFKTPMVPSKYNCGCDSPEQGKSESKSTEEQSNESTPKIVEKRIETRRSTGGKSSDSRRSTDRKSTETTPNSRRSTDRCQEGNSFQQDEFCNYLGLGMNGKIYSPTPTDNKRRSLRVKRLQQQQIETVKRKSESKKEKTAVKELEKVEKKLGNAKDEHEEEVTTTVRETRASTQSVMRLKSLEKSDKEESPRSSKAAVMPADSVHSTPEIKILLQMRTSTPQMTTPPRHTPSTITTANSPIAPTRRIRRTRATSNGTSTCPRSSQSDESPSKATPRRRRLQHHHTRRNNHTSDLSESIMSDGHLNESSPIENGRASTVPSSDGRKEEISSTLQADEQQVTPECLHKKFQRYLEESRKSKPSIFIVDSIDNNCSKSKEPVGSCPANNNNNILPVQLVEEEKSKTKAKQMPKKSKVHRRLLRRNGAFGFTQRILRSRPVTGLKKTKISKHPLRKKIKGIKKKSMPAQLTAEKSAKNIETCEKLSDDFKAQVEEPSSLNEVDEEKKSQFKDLLGKFEDIFCTQTPKEAKNKDAEAQTDSCRSDLPIKFLTAPSSRMQNPLLPENGRVVYIYYELDTLTVVQELMVTFWKISKLIQVFSTSTNEWVCLGECKRLLNDEEIHTPYKNRICVHNSIPIYVEMRAKELSKRHRDCNLISVYINVYFYHDEELVAKRHSIQVDTVASLPQNVAYTTITDSRYFIMCWPQETVNKPRSGWCKYSLTPHLDTLASIREFKCMEYEIRFVECTADDNLIGFGDTQVTLWDHRSGDILMHYDFKFKLGSNFGSIYYPPLEVGDKTVLILQQTSPKELAVIAINISHSAPSHRFVCTHILPPEFENLQSSMRTDDYVILTNADNEELWIDCSDPKYMVQFKALPGQSRFYARCKQNVIDVAENHLALETLNNYVFKMINAPST